MKQVWKYCIHNGAPTMMPVGAKILSVHEQRGEICIWAMVDPTAPKEPRQIEVYGTGHSIAFPDGLKFLGTAHLGNGTFVFHVFERTA